MFTIVRFRINHLAISRGYMWKGILKSKLTDVTILHHFRIDGIECNIIIIRNSNSSSSSSTSSCGIGDVVANIELDDSVDDDDDDDDIDFGLVVVVVVVRLFIYRHLLHII